MGKYSAVESLLIEEVQKYPAIWKTTDPEYKNRGAKDSAWEAITETVNAAASTTYSGELYTSRMLCFELAFSIAFLTKKICLNG